MEWNKKTRQWENTEDQKSLDVFKKKKIVDRKEGVDE